MKSIATILVSVIVFVAASEPECEAKRSDVNIYFYSAANPSTGVLVNTSDASRVANTAFSTNKDTVFYIHGWMDQYSGIHGQLIKDSFLKLHDVNMFIVDWSSLADHISYEVVFKRIEPVGRVLGGLIHDLVQTSKLNLKTTRIVGHSFGAHVGGVAGTYLNGKVDHIVGLDPAGRLFTKDNTANRLSTSSAKFVEAFHTCGGRWGYLEAIAHADYFPNGGSSQPGCILDLGGTCSHVKILEYYSESILTGKFKAKKCGSFDDYLKGKCDNAEVSYMGGYDVNRMANGTYYLETNKNRPYAKD